MSSAKQSSKKKSSKLMRILTLPIRVFIKAKDNYVNSMNNLATPTNYGSFMGLPGASASRSSSVKSSSSSTYHTEDLAELIRSASVSATASLSRNSSTSSNNNDNNTSMSLTEIYMIKKQLQETKQPSAASNIGSRKVPRSFSVGMGKIDEDSPCDDFGEKKGKKSKTKTKPNLYSSTGTEFMYPRSKSHAVGPRNPMF